VIRHWIKVAKEGGERLEIRKRQSDAFHSAPSLGSDLQMTSPDQIPSPSPIADSALTEGPECTTVLRTAEVVALASPSEYSSMVVVDHKFCNNSSIDSLAIILHFYIAATVITMIDVLEPIIPGSRRAPGPDNEGIVRNHLIFDVVME
jgi:hypothetical protein